MRILISGAGIAGMTLAALLERIGLSPTVVERAPSTAHAGYMLGLYRLGSRVLHGLGLYDRFAAQSVECEHYVSYGDHGDRIAEWSLAPIAGKYGPLLSCTRPELVELLRSAVSRLDVRFERTIEQIDASDAREVQVVFSDGERATFDLVVAADGIGSHVRRLVFGEQPRYDSGWGGWVWWAPSALWPPDTFVEWWGAGRFLGAYPTRSAIGIFAGGPLDGDFSSDVGRRERLLARFAGMGSSVDEILASLPPDGEEMFFWHLSDVRSTHWIHHRVVLLGDAAAGFLPTAGIGASMAMESAAVLADELSRTDARFLDQALHLYEKRRRRRVEAIQDDSRRLAHLMFVRSAPLAAIRNYASRFMSLESAMGSITAAFDEPI